jgi:putative ABC transport system permease protein
VAQRAHELGIRMALGAQVANVVKLVMSHGLVLSLAGMVAGLAGSLLFAGFMSSLLFNTHAIDPVTFGAVALVLQVVALLACFVPAYRASRIDPANVLRQE